MRDILFKAKSLADGEWKTGQYVCPGYPITGVAHHAIDSGVKLSEIDRETLSQYTGLTDKNGDKIWENDIVKIDSEQGHFVCEWNDETARFVLTGDTLVVDFDNFYGYELEVVGNVCDNHKMLEEAW